jgi:outer membrane protein assembly factor BamB
MSILMAAYGLRTILVAVTLLAMVVPAANGAASSPSLRIPPLSIPQDPGYSSVMPFLGHPRPAQPIQGATFALRHPFMEVNDRSNLHNDAYQSDAGRTPGPLGYLPKVQSTLYTQECASTTFDARGRILTVCVGLGTVDLRLLDPSTLDVLADYPLPPRSASTFSHPFTSFGGGGYFYLDNQDRVVVPTSDGHIDVIAETGSADSPSLTLQRSYDVSAYVKDSPILSALPDWDGRLWFISVSGVVGVVDPASGATRATALPNHESIGNSMAVDETGGVFVVSDHALYRFDADAAQSPAPTWRQPYDAGTRQKPGQSEFGSGTTPTIIRHGSDHYVAITDNADPQMHVLVYRADHAGPGTAPICSMPVFAPNRSATDNSLIAFGDALVVENNYGYTGPQQMPPSATPARNTPTTEPGLTRINVDYDRGGCHTAWNNARVRVPTSVSKASSATGLVYIYEHPSADEVRYKSQQPATGPEDPWYLTALDARNGRRVWSVFTGVGLGYNNNYAPITLGPDGTAYVGVLGGLVAVRDTGPEQAR